MLFAIDVCLVCLKLNWMKIWENKIPKQKNKFNYQMPTCMIKQVINVAEFDWLSYSLKLIP